MADESEQYPACAPLLVTACNVNWLTAESVGTRTGSRHLAPSYDRTRGLFISVPERMPKPCSATLQAHGLPSADENRRMLSNLRTLHAAGRTLGPSTSVRHEIHLLRDGRMIVRIVYVVAGVVAVEAHQDAKPAADLAHGLAVDCTGRFPPSYVSGASAPHCTAILHSCLAPHFRRGPREPVGSRAAWLGGVL